MSLEKAEIPAPVNTNTTQAPEYPETNWSFLDDRTPCEDCWQGEYKETGYRYCGNNKCPVRPGAGN